MHGERQKNVNKQFFKPSSTLSNSLLHTCGLKQLLVTFPVAKTQPRLNTMKVQLHPHLTKHTTYKKVSYLSLFKLLSCFAAACSSSVFFILRRGRISFLFPSLSLLHFLQHTLTSSFISLFPQPISGSFLCFLFPSCLNLFLDVFSSSFPYPQRHP